jgi:hypothetical protein
MAGFHLDRQPSPPPQTGKSERGREAENLKT